MRDKFFMAPLTVVLTFLIASQTAQLSCNNKQTASAPQSTTKSNELFSKYNLDKIKLPPGFKISVFA